MSSKRLLSVHRTFAFRLTLWYAGIFLFSAAVAFAFFYFLITSTLRGRTDQDLLSEVRSFASLMALQGVEAVKRQALLESQAAGEKKIFVQLLYPDGRLFSSSNFRMAFSKRAGSAIWQGFFMRHWSYCRSTVCYQAWIGGNLAPANRKIT